MNIKIAVLKIPQVGDLRREGSFKVATLVFRPTFSNNKKPNLNHLSFLYLRVCFVEVHGFSVAKKSISSYLFIGLLKKWRALKKKLLL